MNQFEKRVKAATLTKIERQVADYIFKNYDKVSFMKASDIASQIGVSASSVIRLSKALGYDSYTEMLTLIRKDVLQEIEKNALQQASPDRKFADRLAAMDIEDPLTAYLGRAQSIMDSLALFNSTGKFLQARDIILSARTCYIAGFHGCRCAADMLSVHFKRILPNTVTLTHTDADTISQLLSMTRDDCLVLFSNSRYTKMALDAVKIAVLVQAKIVVATDQLTAPVAVGADVVLLSGHESGSFFNSSLGSMMIGELLSVMVSKERAEETQQRLHDMEEYLVEDMLF